MEKRFEGTLKLSSAATALSADQPSIDVPSPMNLGAEVSKILLTSKPDLRYGAEETMEGAEGEEIVTLGFIESVGGEVYPVSAKDDSGLGMVACNWLRNEATFRVSPPSPNESLLSSSSSELFPTSRVSR